MRRGRGRLLTNYGMMAVLLLCLLGIYIADRIAGVLP